MHLLDETVAWDPFPPNTRRNDSDARRDANRAVAVSALGLGLTGAVELLIALVSGSVALLGDALHNLSDVSTSAMVFVGFHVSKRPATPARPYGHERAEDLAGLGVAAVVWASAVLAAIVSWHKLVVHGRTSHVGAGIAAAAVGIVGNQVVARYKRHVGTRIRSATLLSDAQHSWLDALSSTGALVGLVGVSAGWRWADPAAGLVVTVFILHVGWTVTRDLFDRLMDGVDPEVITGAERAASAVRDVRHTHVRARWSGRSLLVEVEGFLDAGTTLEESDRVGRSVEDAVFDALPEATAVLWSPRAMPANVR